LHTKDATPATMTAASSSLPDAKIFSRSAEPRLDGHEDGLLDIMLPLDLSSGRLGAPTYDAALDTSSEASASMHASPAISESSAEDDDAYHGFERMEARTRSMTSVRLVAETLSRLELQSEARSLPMPCLQPAPEFANEGLHKASEMYERIRGSSVGGEVNLGPSPVEELTVFEPVMHADLDAVLLSQGGVASDWQAPDNDLIFDLDL